MLEKTKEILYDIDGIRDVVYGKENVDYSTFSSCMELQKTSKGMIISKEKTKNYSSFKVFDKIIV